VNDTLEEWFRREILPHEAALMRFLGSKWTRAEDAQDLRHDIYVRILEAAAVKRPTSPRGFLLSVARHLLIDRARRDRVVSIDLLEDVDALNVLIDEVSPERATTGRQQVQRLSALFDQLPGRCREVVWMRRVEDLPQKEIASRLGIAEATVEKHLVRGISLLASAVYGVARIRKSAAQDVQEVRTEPRHVDE
jgi:RNA polymerase sigma-70 factor (ECF subfamily)